MFIPTISKHDSWLCDIILKNYFRLGEGVNSRNIMYNGHNDNSWKELNHYHRSIMEKFCRFGTKNYGTETVSPASVPTGYDNWLDVVMRTTVVTVSIHL